MSVRALRGVGGASGRCLGDLHVEADRQILGWVAGCVVASLISKGSTDNVFAGLHAAQGVNHDIDVEISGVDVQLLVGRKGKAHVLALGINGLADNDVGGGVDFERGRDEELGLGAIGIDVISLSDVECQGSARALRLDRGDCGRIGQRDNGPFGTEFVLAKRARSQSQ